MRAFKQARADRQAARSLSRAGVRTPRAGRLRGGRAARALLVAALSGGGAAIAGAAGRAAPAAATGGKNPYRGNGMWIWYVSRSSGGDLARIARKAHRHRIETVYIKSSDGGRRLEPVHPRPGLLPALRGLRVCAWQFVYGNHPGAEARRGAQAVRKGADCLVIDAESSYEGRYAAADKYINKLRRRIGRELPDRARRLPLRRLPPRASRTRSSSGPAARSTTCPQVYWHTIGARSAGLQAHLHLQPRLRRPIEPLGQTYDNPPIRQIQRFRRWRSPTASRRQLVGLAGDEQAGVAGAREEDRRGRGGRATGPGYPTLARAAAATSSCGRRST